MQAVAQRSQLAGRAQPLARGPRAVALAARPRRCAGLACRAEQQQQQQQQGVSTTEPAASTSGASPAIDKELSKFTSKTAATFAPRASGAVKNPAVKGSALYWVFEAQAWIALAVGGLLSFNVLFPTDEPSIPRLMGMWSIWMFTVPSLRAKECMPREKDALNLLFLVIPLLNVALPFVAKSFPLIFAADVAALAGIYAWKGVWSEVYGLPIGADASEAPAAAAAGGDAAGGEGGQQQ